MFPVKRFNELPVVSGLDDSDKIFCIANNSDSIVSISTLKVIFGTGNSSGASINIAGSYSGLLNLEAGSEYYEAPFLYKKYPFGVFRINVDTDFSIPTGSGIANGIVVSTYADLIVANPGYEYYESPYIYKRAGTGIVRINPDTDFDEP